MEQITQEERRSLKLPSTTLRVIELLNAAACPSHCYNGVIVRDDSCGDIEQCQFCYERERAISALQEAEPVRWMVPATGGVFSSLTAAINAQRLHGDDAPIIPLYALPRPPAKAEEPKAVTDCGSCGYTADPNCHVCSPPADRVPIPQNRDQAELMQKVGYAWLEQHAPERLKSTKESLKNLKGVEVSVDVSTCDADSGHRVFATITGWQDSGNGKVILLAEKDSCNFSPPAKDESDTDLAELITKTILFEDCGNTSDWQDNINLGEAVVKALKKHITKDKVPIGEAIAELSSDPEFVKGLEDGRRWIRDAKAQVPRYAPPDFRLAECPCCGSLDVGGNTDRVYCYTCGLTMIKPPPLQNAIDAWNTRKAIASAQMPEGWRLAPIEPTHEMIQADRDAPLAGPDDEDAPEDYRIVYKAMLAASPAPDHIGDGNEMDLPGGYVPIPIEPNPEHITAIEWQIGPEGRTAGTAAGIYKAIIGVQRQQEDAER